MSLVFYRIISASFSKSSIGASARIGFRNGKNSKKYATGIIAKCINAIVIPAVISFLLYRLPVAGHKFLCKLKAFLYAVNGKADIDDSPVLH